MAVLGGSWRHCHSAQQEPPPSPPPPAAPPSPPRPPPPVCWSGPSGVYSGTATLNVLFVPVKFTIKFEAWRTSALAGRVNFAVSGGAVGDRRCTDIPWTMACQGGAMYIASDATPCWSQFTGEVKNLRITYYDWSKRMRVRFEHPLLTSKGDSSAYCRCRCTEETASEQCSIQVRRRLGSPIL